MLIKLILVLTLSLISAKPASAFTATDVKTTITQRRLEIDQNRQLKKEAIRLKKLEHRAEFATRHATRLTNRFNKYYRQLFKLIEKFRLRAQIMADKGMDTSPAIVKINQASGQLDEALTASQESVGLFSSIGADTWEAQKDITLKARDLALEARSLFKQAKDSLKEAILLMAKTAKPTKTPKISEATQAAETD